MTSNSTEGRPDRIANVERMVILMAMEKFAQDTKDAQQRDAIWHLHNRLANAHRITLESAP